jgi:hypothetical protein
MMLRTHAADGKALGGGSHLIDRLSTDAYESTPVFALDSILGPSHPISIIQLDVEGHEQLALTGALETIQRWKPVLIVETMPHAGWIEEYLTPLGYEFQRKLHVNSVLSIQDF